MFKALIVDDEKPAREELKYLLEQHPNVQEVIEAQTAKEAVEKIIATRDPVLFLDIHMPQVSGMQLAEKLHDIHNPPLIVFVTAYAEHAAKAFDIEAIDYLLKPVEESRLNETIEKIEHALMEKKREEAEGLFGEALTIEDKDLEAHLSLEAIDYIDEVESVSQVHAFGKSYALNVPIAALEAKLPESDFCRVHRSIIVNIHKVATTEVKIRDGMKIYLHNTSSGTPIELPVSRRRFENLKKSIKLRSLH